MCLKPLLYLCFTPLNIPILSIVNTLLHHVIVSSYREFYHDIIYIRSCLLPFTLGLVVFPSTLLCLTLLYYLHYYTTYFTLPFTTLLHYTLLYTTLLYTTLHYFTIYLTLPLLLYITTLYHTTYI